jgi:hypothetical protein
VRARRLGGIRSDGALPVTDATDSSATSPAIPESDSGTHPWASTSASHPARSSGKYTLTVPPGRSSPAS